MPKLAPSFWMAFCEMKTKGQCHPSQKKKKFQTMLLLSPRNKKEFAPMPFHSSVYFWNWEDVSVSGQVLNITPNSTESIPMGHWIPVTEKRRPTLGDQSYLVHFQAFTPCLLLKNNINDRNHNSEHAHSVQDYYQLPKNSKFLSGTQHRRQHCVLLQQDAFEH